MNKVCIAGCIAGVFIGLAARADDKDLYTDIVAPIIKAKCLECHCPEKVKGKLRMDSYALIMKGGENGKDIVPGEPKKSRWYKQLMLPKSDDDHMPPIKKEQTTPAENAVFRWWIEKGAPEHMKLSEAGAIPEDAKPAIDGAAK